MSEIEQGTNHRALAVPPNNALRAREAAALKELERWERMVTEGECKAYSAFLEIGKALQVIRDKRLYEPRYGQVSFESYCRNRWNYTTTHANRLIGESQIHQELAPIGVKFKNEWAARQLLPYKDRGTDLLAIAKELPEGKPVDASTVRGAIERAITLQSGAPTTPTLTGPQTASSMVGPDDDGGEDEKEQKRFDEEQKRLDEEGNLLPALDYMDLLGRELLALGVERWEGLRAVKRRHLDAQTASDWRLNKNLQAVEDFYNKY